MRRGRTLIFVFLLIIVIAVVAFLAYNQFLAIKPPDVDTSAYVEVYIAAQPISQGGTIKQEQLTTIKIAPENEVEVMFTVNETHPEGLEFAGQSVLVGKTAKFPLEQGVMITSAMVGDLSSTMSIPGPSWAALVPPGMTAMSIPANRFSLSGYAINNGAHVNLNACFLFVDVDPTFQTILPNLTAILTGTGFGTVSSTDGSSAEGLPILSLGVSTSGATQGRLELDPSLQQPYYILPSETTQRPRMVCQMLLQDVVVLKVGDFSRDAGATIDTPSAATTDANGQPIPTTPPDIITLIVTPQDSITLTYLLNIQQKSDTAEASTAQTQFSMTLRNPNDTARQATEASTLQFLLGQYNIPVPAKLPYALQPALFNLLPPVDETATAATP